MFFSTELLSKRDSGYGLLWLAATLGSKSKKLPRRSVLTADIQQLCVLISEPPEPLALRLSSNLMVGVVRVYKCLQTVKHEMFHNDVSNCFTSLKKTLQELHSMGGSSLDMAQPNGLRDDALNIVAEPGMAMLTELDGNDLSRAVMFCVTRGEGWLCMAADFLHLIKDWDFVFRKAGEATIDGEFDPDVSPKLKSFVPTKLNLHKLDESHEHLFSSSFLNSLSGEVDAGGNNELSSSANGVLFDLDFGPDPEVGLGEEMERELEEAGFFLKPKQGEDEETDLAKVPDLERSPKAFNADFEANVEVGMDFGDAFEIPSGVQQGQKLYDGDDIPQIEENQEIVSDWLKETGILHTPPPHDKTPHRSCLSRRSPEFDRAGAPEGDGGKCNGSKRHRKKVKLLDPRTELTDDQLKFQRDNYLNEMKRLRREALRKKELREGKRKFEEMLWAPPADFLAPELINFYNQRVVYPVKAREAAWRKEVEELQVPKKRQRLEADIPQELNEEPAYDLQEPGAQNTPDYEFPIDADMNFMDGMGGDVVIEAIAAPEVSREDQQSGSRRSSDSPGRPRHALSRPLSPRNSQSAHIPFDPDDSQPISNSLFPWDHAGPSSTSGAPAASLDMSGLDSKMRLSMDNIVVRRIRRTSKTGSVSDSPILEIARAESLQPLVDVGGATIMDIESPRLDFEASHDEPNFMETQESEGMVTLERNSFNFLGYAKMHTVSSSGPLYFSDLVPADSSSARVAAEGFYHCLALATKNLIRLKQNKAFGSIEIQIK